VEKTRLRLLSGVVVNCGEILVIPGFASVCRAVSSGDWELETCLFDCENVDVRVVLVDILVVPDTTADGFGRNDGSLVDLERTTLAGGRYTSHPSQRREGWGTRGFVVC
jgi:hypothetical protein